MIQLRQSGFGASSNLTNLHTRPHSIQTLLKLAPAPQSHGGLSAGAMRRVREYVEVHLGESIDLSMLAGVAGLSVHHFARQFKQSVGVTPHHYLTQKRVERAQEMWLRRISRCRKSLLRPAFLSNAIWRVISVTYSVLRLASFGGRSASEPDQHWICVSDLSKWNGGFRVPCAAR